MRDVRKIGRRTWLTRSASGLLAIWAGLDFGFGRQGWGITISRPRGPATAQELTAAQELTPAEALRVTLGQNGFVSAYVLVRGGEAAIVDTGVAGSAPRIGEVIQTAGLGWDAVRHVVLTHYHGDHAGSIGDVLTLAPGAAVYAGEADIPRITAPREMIPVADGSEVFGMQIIATPGDTLGHVSVYDPIGSALITGDAIVNVGGNLAGSSPQFTADMAQTTAPLFLVQDGAPYHRAAPVKAFFAQHRDRLHVTQLPSYSPDYNPIEFLWRATKRQATHNRYFPEFETLIGSVEEALAFFAAHPDRVKALFGRYLDDMTATATVDAPAVVAAA